MSNRLFMCFPDFKEKALTLSYDDGVVYDKQLVEILKSNGIKATFNVSSALFGKGRKLAKEQAQELYVSNEMEVAVHGQNHLPLAKVESAVAIADVLLDRKQLEETFGCVVKGMAYAFGSYNDSVIDILKKCGINYARTVAQTGAFNLPENWLEWNPTCHHKNPQLMELAKIFVQAKRGTNFCLYNPKLFYVWGHSYEFNDENNWEIIEQFAKYIGNREDIWYATNGEIFNYVNAYDRLEWSVDCCCVYNPSCLDVYINYYGRRIIVKAGQRVSVG